MATTLRLPLQVAGGALRTLEQDSLREIGQSVALLLATRPGERRSVPDYGTPDPLFDGFNPAAAVAAIAEWEPRAAGVTPQLLDAGRIQQVLVEINDTTTTSTGSGGA